MPTGVNLNSNTQFTVVLDPPTPNKLGAQGSNSPLFKGSQRGLGVSPSGATGVG